MDNLISKKLLQKCPICGENYNYSKIKLLEANDSHILSFFKCQKCESGIAMKILLLPTGMIGQAVLTDLEADEIMRFKKRANITSSDVLYVYDFMKQSGDVLKEIK
jgi:hypothetical protein